MQSTDMRSSLRESPKWVMFLGIILVLIGILIAFVPFLGEKISHFQKLFGVFFSEIGFAFIIAFLLIVGIDHKEKRRHSHEISKNMFSYLYGVMLDKKVFRSIEEEIFQSPTMRENYNIDYEFLEIIGENIIIGCDIHYRVRNLTEQVVEHDIKLVLEKPSHIADASIDRLRNSNKFGPSRVVIDNNSLSDDQMDQMDKNWSNTRNYFRYKTVRTLEPGKYCDVTVSYKMIKDIRDSEFFRTSTVASNLEFDIRYLDGIKVHAVPIYLGNNHRFNPAEDEISTSNRLRLTINSPLLPKNGVLMWWSPVEPTELDHDMLS